MNFDYVTELLLTQTADKITEAFVKSGISDLIEVEIGNGLLKMRDAFAYDILSECGDLEVYADTIDRILKRVGYTNMAELDMGDTSILYFGPNVPPLIFLEEML